jgi:hypothetical protein
MVMIAMSFLQNDEVWNFEFGYCDLVVICFLVIVIYLLTCIGRLFGPDAER